ncbi:DEAD/DEAH box helicase family protein [Streptomyces sp. NBC_00111]|uniref:DEAD/DEAH box helicase family protein n=1 Tax=unclassified Streptomyces TaxID=2593676 RepID=UPI003863DB30
MERSTLAKIRLRAHQREAVDAVLRALELPPGARIPARGLRTQVITATGSGKAYVAARCADELEADRLLILVPSLDLLTQTEQAWRDSGRTGPVIGSPPCAVRRRPSRTPRTPASSWSGPAIATR